MQRLNDNLNHKSWLREYSLNKPKEEKRMNLDKIETKMYPFLETVARNGYRTTLWRPKRINEKR